jgi:hypothetical protein
LKTILVLAWSDLASDPRVDRQLRWLSGTHAVVAAGLAPPAVAGVRFVEIGLPPPPPFVPRRRSVPERAGSLARRVLSASRDAGRAARKLAGFHVPDVWEAGFLRFAQPRLSGISPDLVLANDVHMLPLAFSVAGDAPVILDAHEYAPGQLEHDLGRRILDRRAVVARCRRYLPRLAAMTTVCEGIADLYERDAGVRPAVVTNAPDFEPLLPRPKPEGDPSIRMIHHGAALPARRIENMIAVMDHLDRRFSLDLLLAGGDRGYLGQLEALARTRPAVRILPPVPMRELAACCNRYDLGLFLLPPTNTNYRLALPNKFFEYVQGRLAIAVGPSPEMARIVRERDLGVVADDFTPVAMARALSSLTTGSVNRFKANSDAAARDLSSGPNRDRMLELVGRVLGGKAGRP